MTGENEPTPLQASTVSGPVQSEPQLDSKGYAWAKRPDGTIFIIAAWAFAMAAIISALMAAGSPSTNF